MKKLALLALLLASACVTTAQEGEEMRKDIAGLKTSLAQEQQANAAERERVAKEAADRAKQLQDALDALNKAARKSGADLAVDLEKAQNDIAALHGQLDVIQHRLDALEKAQADQSAQVAQANQLLQQQKAAQEKAEHPTDRLGIYNLARTRLDAGQTARARELYADFLQRFPRDELAGPAQYWLGETWYAEKKWNEAIVEFQKVLKNYKTSDKVPDALVKIGLSFQAQGDCQNALLFYEEAVQSHPRTPAAKLAREKTAECRRRR